MEHLPHFLHNLILIDGLGTCNIVRAPLKYSGAVLRRRPAVCPQAEHLETDPVLSSGLEWTHPDLDPTELMPDWTAYDRAMEKSYSSAAEKNPKKPLTFAIGESKMCQCWKSDGIYSGLAGSHIDQYLAPTTDGKLLHKVHDVTEKRIQPLERLATYCRFGETRYGFIITQEELVAIRVRRLDPALISGVLACDKPHAGIEYTSIPWDAFGPGKLTANLAIWALGCMGMNDHHRIMESSGGEPLTSMVRLTKWTHDEKNKVYRNDISGREITEECWKKLGSAAGFVRLDDEDEGASYTRTFTTGGSVSSINQGMRAVALDTISSRGRKAAQEAAQQGKPADQAAGSSSKSEHTDQGAASSNKSISGKIAASEVTIAGEKGALA